MANLKKMIITNGNILNSVSAFSPANNSIAAMSKYEKFELKQNFELKEKDSIDNKDFLAIDDDSLMEQQRDYVNGFLNSFDLTKLSKSSKSEINQEINNTYREIKIGAISISDIKRQIEQNNPDFFNSIKPYIDKSYDLDINLANIKSDSSIFALNDAQDIYKDPKSLLQDSQKENIIDLNKLDDLYLEQQDFFYEGRFDQNQDTDQFPLLIPRHEKTFDL
ncbi:hypothetical protein [Mycoplasmopsis pulmonis]|uniref:hypothetical protein n=1 Tax=Mycoplasmopsis pulmonis TaxID=2107 RepID=UPI0010051351|nr:hypothetical protein [Mycoplasmopsis pulmonis]VEU68175.1 Uncharacterised protein [Mycoplasmopsis pulmonis]